MTEDTNLVFVATKVRRETHRQLRIGAAENDLPLKGYIRQVLEEHGDLETLFEWSLRYIEMTDSGNMTYYEALKAAGFSDIFTRYMEERTNVR